MNLNNVEFFNLGAIEAIPGIGKNGLMRIPIEIRNKLNERARFIGMNSIGIEIRFVTDAPNIEIYLSAQNLLDGKNGFIRIYKGDFLHKIIEIPTGHTEMCRISSPPNFAYSKKSLLYNGGLSPNVWRIVCDRSIVAIHGINSFGHNIRPPEKKEIPAYNWLSYGSSITFSNLDGYPHIAAKKLKVQVQNKGFSGSCAIEKEVVDYLIDECEFDFITCELGVNMRSTFTPEEFERRVSYLINRLIDLNKPSLIISTFPNWKSLQNIIAPDEISNNENAFNEILDDLVSKTKSKVIRFVHGYEILDDVSGLSSDLLHPSSYGHSIMGINLAQYLTPFLSEYGIKVM